MVCSPRGERGDVVKQSNDELDVRAMFESVAKESDAFSVAQVERLASPSSRPWSADYTVRVISSSTRLPVAFAVRLRQRLTPAEALSLKDSPGLWQTDLLPMVCCPYVSPRADEICRDAHVNYLDASGNCRIAAPGFHIVIRGRENKRPDTRPLINPFSSKASRIVRVMLEEPKRAWQLREIAKEAQISVGLASKCKQALVDQAYVFDLGNIFTVRDAEHLLRSWAAAYKSSAVDLPLYSMREPKQAEPALADWARRHQLEYCLAAFSGAWRVAPTVRYGRASAYIQAASSDPRIADLCSLLEAKRVDSGANLSLKCTTDGAELYKSREVHGMRVASPVQLYLDLAHNPGRGEEAAEEILERMLRPKFEKQT